MPRSTSATQPTVQTLEDRLVPNALSGTVYADTNANRIYDAGEMGLANVQVQLDNASDGTPDVVVSTNAQGQYFFPFATGPSATIMVTAPANATALTPTTRVIPLNAPDVSNLNFAFLPIGKLDGQVYADDNANGTRDIGEVGIEGAVVTLDAMGDGSIDQVTRTKADGSYEFIGVADGTSKISVTPPVNFTPTSLNPQTAVISNGAVITGPIENGLRPATGVTGRALVGDPVTGQIGLPEAIVQFDAFSDGTIDFTTKTDSTGSYAFQNVPNGVHQINVVTPQGSTTKSITGGETISTQVSGSLATGQNFGVQLPGGATGSLFQDNNRNNIRDPGERPVTAGQVQVDLLNSGQLVDGNVSTAADGSFRITGLPNGQHTLVVTPPGGTRLAGSDRIPFTVTGNGVATVAPTPVIPDQGKNLVLGNGTGSGAVTYSFSKDAGGNLVATQQASYIPPSRNGSRVVLADFNGDGTDDLIAATGPNEVPNVSVYDGKTGAELVNRIEAFESTFTGGVNLSAGDFNGDGRADIVVSADSGGGPRVRVFNAAFFDPAMRSTTSPMLADFLGIDDPNFRGGARTTVGDLNGDGVNDLIVAAGKGGGPRIAMFDGTSIAPGMTPTRIAGDFFAFESTLRDGAMVGVGDLNGDGRGELIAASGPGGAPRVTIYNGLDIIQNRASDSSRIADFYVANDRTSRNGTRITVKDVDRDNRADVIASLGNTAYVYTGDQLLTQFLAPGGLGPNAATRINRGDLNPNAGLFVG